MNVAELRFSLPDIAMNRNPTVTTDPFETERWLAGLPFLNVADTSHLIANALSEINRTRLSVSQRFKLLELYRTPVHHLSAELQKNYLGLALPLPERSRLIAQQVRQIQTELAYGYKRVTLDASRADLGKAAEKVALAAPIQRAIRSLTDVLVKCYEIYAPLPHGCWRELHDLFSLAEDLGITELTVTDKLNETAPNSSIGQTYKQVLLIALSDPYRLPLRMLDRVQRYLDAHAALAHLSIPSGGPGPNCEYLVCLDDDRADFLHTGERLDHRLHRFRLLNTVDLARVLHEQLKSVKSGIVPPLGGLERELPNSELRELLRRLIVAWGVNPRRSFSRTPANDQALDLAAGIDAISFFLNGSQDFLLSRTEMGPTPARSGLGAMEEQQRYLRYPRPETLTWTLVNESAGGFTARDDTVPRESLRVGELIATRPGGADDGWNIAVVRWLKSVGPSGLEIGVERLAPYARAVAIRPTDSNEPDGGFVAALSLPAVKPIRRPPTLIGPRGLFKSGRVIVMDDGYRARCLLAVRLLELTSSFEQFEYKDVEP